MKTQTTLPGFKAENVMSSVFAVPMAGGLAVIHPSPDGKGYHAEFYEGTGNSSGTFEKSLSGAVREVKRFSKEYAANQSRRGTIRALMRQLTEQL